MSEHIDSCTRSKCLVWDHLVLSQRWAISSAIEFNKDEQFLTRVSPWTLHGLWPGLGPHNTGTEDCLCKIDSGNTPLNLEKALQTEMERKWPEVKTHAGNIHFWEHEWRKHGLAAATHEDLNTPEKYFRKTLELHDKYDLTRILHEAGIDPNNTETYTLKDIEKKMKEAGKPTVFINFVKREHTQYIYELRLYLNDKFELIDCVEHRKSDNYDCEQAIVYPATIHMSRMKHGVTKQA